MSAPAGDRRDVDVAERVRAFVTGGILLDPQARVEDRTPLLRGLVDSTGLMELLSFIEDEFGVPVEYTDIDEENFGSVERIARYVGRARA